MSISPHQILAAYKKHRPGAIPPAVLNNPEPRAKRGTGAKSRSNAEALCTLVSINEEYGIGVTLLFDAKLVTAGNSREPWFVRSRRTKCQRTAVARAVKDFTSNQGPAPWRVTITRIGPRRMDSDNIAGACKACRDGVADAAGMDDDDSLGWQWITQQQVGKTHQVEVKIEPRRMQ